jgi:hypothetical protein
MTDYLSKTTCCTSCGTQSDPPLTGVRDWLCENCRMRIRKMFALIMPRQGAE